jgi:hypothetical protein
MGLAQHELNDLAVGHSELPGLLGDPSLKPDPGPRSRRSPQST